MENIVNLGNNLVTNGLPSFLLAIFWANESIPGVPGASPSSGVVSSEPISGSASHRGRVVVGGCYGLSCLRLYAAHPGGSDERPVHSLRAQVFAQYCAAGLPFDIDTEALSEELPSTDGLAKVVFARAACARESRAVRFR